MKVLVFHIGADRYGLPLGAVERVLPVLDLTRLAGLKREQTWFDTRIILVAYPLADGASASLGLLAEHVTGIEQIAPAALRDSGVDGAPFLGQVAGTDAGMLQLVQLEQLLAPEVRALLFQTELSA